MEWLFWIIFIVLFIFLGGMLLINITIFTSQLNFYIFINKSYNLFFLNEYLFLFIFLSIIYIKHLIPVILDRKFFLYRYYPYLKSFLLLFFSILIVLIYSYFIDIDKELSIFISEFIFLLLSYIEIYNLKFNNLKQTMSNLTINFYGFLVTTTILFGFKIYLSVQNITTPDLYYLFLTIPVSLLIIYFYTKDLTPVIKDLKKVN